LLISGGLGPGQGNFNESPYFVDFSGLAPKLPRTQNLNGEGLQHFVANHSFPNYSKLVSQYALISVTNTEEAAG